MFRRLFILGVSLILASGLLLVGRLSSIDGELISAIYNGIVAVTFVIYIVDAAIEFKNESHRYGDDSKGI